MIFRLLTPLLSLVLLAGVCAQTSFAKPKVPTTYGDAMRWYGEAAKAGDAEAMFYLAVGLEKRVLGEGGPEEALKWYRKSANAGFSLAQLKLGQLHQFGDRVPMDLAEARRYYQLAAAQEMPEAQFNLALLQEQGVGGPVDGASATENYEAAARGGIASALQNLSAIYAEAAAVEQDLVRSMSWALLAVEAGLEEAKPLLEALDGILIAQEKSEARAWAEAWKKSPKN